MFVEVEAPLGSLASCLARKLSIEFTDSNWISDNSSGVGAGFVCSVETSKAAGKERRNVEEQDEEGQRGIREILGQVEKLAMDPREINAINIHATSTFVSQVCQSNLLALVVPRPRGKESLKAEKQMNGR